MKINFEWNQNKAAKNIVKHNVSFEEAATIFDHPMFISVIDEEHSFDEERYVSIGLSTNGRLLMVAHTDRQGRIRLISARKATKNEERFYANSW